MTTEDLVGRLDRLIAVVQLAHRDEIAAAAAHIRSDKVASAILDTAEAWTSSTELQKAVAKKAKVTDRAVRERFAELVANGALEARGTERRMEYRRSGLV